MFNFSTKKNELIIFVNYKIFIKFAKKYGLNKYN